MLSQYFTDFYNNWSRKAVAIQGNELHNIYDKYITLFIIYNCLYNQTREHLVLTGQLVPRQNLDNQNATTLVIQLLGDANIIANFTAKGNDKDIAEIIDVIDREVFHIKLKNGQSQRKEDLKILSNLRSANSSEKALGVLQVLYYVRCNLFHGHKNYVEYQRMLVEPLINILATLNTQLYAELIK